MSYQRRQNRRFNESVKGLRYIVQSAAGALRCLLDQYLVVILGVKMHLH